MAQVCACLFLLFIFAFQLICSQTSINNVSLDNSTWQNISNLSRRSHENFPADLMPDYIRNTGGIVLHVFIFLYICLGMGIICDAYFLPSLEIISQVLSLPPDIAGATFMAIGSSAPDLFTSIIGVFVSEDDIGIGAILGSSVFNLIAVPAICGFTAALFCPLAPTVTRFPVIRDSFFYILAIITLIITIKDNMVDWVESTILICLFSIYLVLMYFNAKYSNQIQSSITSEENSSLHQKSRHEWKRLKFMITTFPMSQYKKVRISSTKRIVFTEPLEVEDRPWFKKIKFCKFFLYPLNLLFKMTMPKPNKYIFVLTFLLSIVWLGALTYISVWMVTIIGFTLGLPDNVAGMTILAAGASIPDLIGSVLVVKKAGKANMAISNSIGSNIFGILFCLSVPWLIKSIITSIRKGTIDLVATAVPINSTALPLTTSSLLVCIFALIITLYATHWKLGLGVGIVCSIIYILFVATSSTLEIILAP